MYTDRRRLGVISIAAILTFAPLHHSATLLGQTVKTSPCAADSSFQRLAFWVGDWEVLDSTGNHYAYQLVRPAIDQCAITAEWTGRVGDKGLNISAYDVATHAWKQVYFGNQVPSPLGVQLRKSDPSYDGPGIRFIPLLDAPSGNLSLARVTIMPMGEGRVEQLFESSSDGGATWRVVFKAEHRRRG
jgi:hypothetical protein